MLEITNDGSDRKSSIPDLCLIVDDEDSVRAFLRAVVERQGFRCLEAENASAALRIIQGLNGNLTIVITDINMPGDDVTGVDLAYSVRNLFPSIEVVLVTGYAEDGILKRAGKTFPMIKKPFGIEAIVQMVTDARKRRSGVQPQTDADSRG